MAGGLTAAIVGVTAIGASIYGASESSKAASKAAKSQDKSMQAATDVSMAQLDFQMQQYEDWQSVFGDIQQNLSKYYNTMTPETQAAVGLQNIQQEYQKSRENLQRQLAQRGISNSGVMAEGLTQLEMSRALASANTRAQAPQQVAQQQASFLGLGLGQQGALQAGISTAYGQQAQLFSNQAGVYGQQAAMAGQSMGQAIGAIGSVAGQFIGAGGFGTSSAAQPSVAPSQSQYSTLVNPGQSGYIPLTYS